MRDNKTISNQLAEVTRDLEVLRAEIRSLAEDPEVNKLTNNLIRVEKVVKANNQAAQQGLKSVKSDITALQGQQTAMVDRVTSLTNTVTLVEATQASMKELLDTRHAAHTEMEARMAALEKEAGIVTPPTHPSMMAFHLVGLGAIQEAVGDMIPRGVDPVDVVRRLLGHVGMQFYMTRVQLLGVTVTEAGREAKSAIIHFTSEFHKNEALIRVKKVLGQLGTAGVIAEHCFPASALEDVRLLKYYGYQQKASGKAAKYRIVNRDGRPVLQTGATPLGRYTDLQPPATLTKEAMEAEQAARGYHRRPVETYRRPPPPAPAVEQPGQQRKESRRPTEEPARFERRHGDGVEQRNPPPTQLRDKDSWRPRPEDRGSHERRNERRPVDQRYERRHGDGGVRPFNGYWSPPRGPVPLGHHGGLSSQHRRQLESRNADTRQRR